MATAKKLSELTFAEDENEGPAPTEFAIPQLLNILGTPLAEVCFRGDADLAELDPKAVARITKKAILTIGRMGRLFN